MPRPDEQGKLLETLRRQHGKLDKQVVQLEERRWLSASEEAEVRRLKRLKLAAKDKMRELQPET